MSDVMGSPYFFLGVISSNERDVISYYIYPFTAFRPYTLIEDDTLISRFSRDICSRFLCWNCRNFGKEGHIPRREDVERNVRYYRYSDDESDIPRKVFIRCSARLFADGNDHKIEYCSDYRPINRNMRYSP